MLQTQKDGGPVEQRECGGGVQRRSGTILPPAQRCLSCYSHRRVMTDPQTVCGNSYCIKVNLSVDVPLYLFTSKQVSKLDRDKQSDF